MTHWRLVVTGVVLVALVVGVIVAWPWVRIYTGSAPPNQFYRSISPIALPTGRHVLGIAHNAGNNPTTTAAALDHGADVIEIDVTTARGVLVAGRAHGFRWLAERVFRGSTLAQAWRYASAARIIKLDLQRNDKSLLDSLIDFLRPRSHDRPVMVSTRDADAIAYLRSRLSADVTLLFSVPFPDAVSRVQSDPALVADIGGVSVFSGLVSADFVSWAHERRLLVLAWTVNDATQCEALLRLGVDGITTANLAILQALSG